MLIPVWLIRLLNRFGFRQDTLVCMRASHIYFWPAHLGNKTLGKCACCGIDVYYEQQNWVFSKKLCQICQPPPTELEIEAYDTSDV